MKEDVMRNVLGGVRAEVNERMNRKQVAGTAVQRKRCKG
jgi:hypothetical protein